MKSALNAFFLLLVLASNAQARVWTLAPAQAVSVANPEESSVQSGGMHALGADAQLEGIEISEAFFRFDLSPIAEDGDLVTMVSLEWPLDGINPDSLSTFLIYSVLDSTILAPGSVPNTTDSNLIGIWEFSPLDYARNEGGFVLFDLSQIAKNWLSGSKPNLGVVIKTGDVSQEQLQAQLAKARMVVR